MFQNRLSWYLGLSAYWFAASFKWFILLVVLLPAQVAAVARDGEKNTYWGLVFAVGATWAIIGPSIFGNWSDRVGKRIPFVMAGAITTCGALVVLATATSIWQLGLGYLLLQVSDDIGTGPYSALVPQLVPEEHRGKASAAMTSLTLVSQLVVGALAMALRETWHIYLLIAAVTLAGAGVVGKTLGKEPERTAAPSPGRGFDTWLKPWRDSNFRWVWLTRFLHSLGFYLVEPYLRNYLNDLVPDRTLFGYRLGSADSATIVLAMAIAVSGAVGAALSGPTSDRFGRKTVIYVGGLTMASVLVPFLFIRQFEARFGLAILFGLGYGAYISADWALASDVMPEKGSLGKDMGIWQMSVSCVQVFAGGAGRIIDAGNQVSPGMGYQVVFLLAGVAVVAGTVLVGRIRGFDLTRRPSSSIAGVHK